MPSPEFIFDNTDTKVFLTTPSGTPYQLTLDDGGSFLISFSGTGSSISDPRLSVQNEVRVKKNPGMGEFLTISGALASITGNDSSNRFSIIIGPGIYTEDSLHMRQYVSLIGDGQNSTVIQASNSGNTIIYGSDFSEIEHVTLSGSNQSGTFSVVHSTGASTSYFGIENVKFGNNYGHVKTDTTGTNSATILVQNCTYGSDGQFYRGFFAVNTGSGSSRIQIRNSTSIGMTQPFPTEFALSSGPGTEIIMNGVQSRVSNTTQTGNVNFAVAENGGRLRLASVNARGWAKGVWVKNVGEASSVSVVGVNIEGCTEDLVVDHPSASGVFAGIADANKVTIAPQNFSLLINGSTEPSISVAGDINLKQDGDFVEVGDLLLNGGSMGLTTGGELTPGTGLNVVVASGFGYLMSGSFPVHELMKVEWNSQSLAISPSGDNHIFFNSAGVLTAAASEPGNTSNIILGRAITDATGISFIDQSPVTNHHMSNLSLRFLNSTIGALYSAGSIVSENTGNAFQIDVSSGEYYFGTNKFVPTGGTGVSFLAYYHSGTSTFVPSGTNSVSNTQYDNGVELTGLSASFYAKHGFYGVGDGIREKYLLVYAQTQYSGLTEAQGASSPTPPGLFHDGVVHLSDIIVQQGSGNIVEIVDARPIFATQASLSGGGGGVTVHGNLLGLLSDDHPQYVLTDGGRTMTGNLELGGNDINNVSLINSVNITGHASRHLPNGADSLATTAPATNLSASSSNSAGTANSLSRSDHSHAIDFTVNIPLANFTTINTTNITGTNISGTNLNVQNAVVANTTTSQTVNAATFTGTSLVTSTVNALTSSFAPIVGGQMFTGNTAVFLNITGTNLVSGVSLLGQVANIGSITGNTLNVTGTANLTSITGTALDIVGFATINSISGNIIRLSGNDIIMTGTSLGAGEPIFAGQTLNTLNFKQVSGVGSITLSSTSSVLTISGSSVAGSSITTPSVTTESGIAIWSGTTGGGFRNTTITINPSNDIVLPNGSDLLNATSGTNVLGSDALPFATIFSDVVNATGVYINGRKVLSRQTVSFLMDNGGSVLQSGTQGHLLVPFGGSIGQWSLLADVSGNLSVDVRRVAYTNWIGSTGVTSTSSIVSADKPTITASHKNTNNTVTTWSGIAANDALIFHIDTAPSNITRANLTLFITPTGA